MLVAARAGVAQNPREALVVIRWCENHQQPALFVVVGREDVSDGLGGQIVLGVDVDRLALDANLPLQCRADVV
jgi:hypothetical protein